MFNTYIKISFVSAHKHIWIILFSLIYVDADVRFTTRESLKKSVEMLWARSSKDTFSRSRVVAISKVSQ